MATTIRSLQTRVIFKFQQTDNTQGVNTVTPLTDLAANTQLNWSVGTNTVNSANQIFVPATMSFAGGNTQTIDLANSTANKNVTNVALTLARAKGFFIQVANTTSTTNGTLINGILVNGLVTNSALDARITVPPGGVFTWINPTPNGNTIDSTHKLITLTNLDATNTANTVVVGVIGSQT